MHQVKELISSAFKKLNVKSFKIVSKLKRETKFEKIIQLYQQPYTDQEISALLYPEGKDQNFRKLKSRTIEKSTNLILAQIDNIKLRNKYDNSIFTVQKLLLVSNLLIIKDNRTVAESLLKKALRIALSVQYTQYIIEVARLLSFSSAYQGKTKSFNYYSKIVIENMNLYSIELTLESDYYSLVSKITDSAEYTEKIKEELNILYSKIKNIFNKHKSHTLQLLFFRTGIRYFHSIHDFINMIRFTQSAIKYMNSNPKLMQNARTGEFSLFEMDGCLRLKAYKQGAECAIRCGKYFIPYTSTWSVFYEYYFLLAMRTLNFKKAKEIYNTINVSRYRLSKMLERQREKWKIFEAYLYFATNESTPSKQFNLYKYLNELEILNKDKKGFNYLVIISKFLLLLNLQDYDNLYGMEDSFRVYFRRYIKLNEYPRHNIFGNFILKVFKEDFEFKNIDCEIYLERLQLNSNLEETEIIPYEKLIKLIQLKCNIFTNL